MIDFVRRPWFRLLAILLGLAAFLWGLYFIRDALTPFAVAFALAYFLNPVVNRLERLLARALGRVPWLARRVEPRLLAVGTLAVGVALALVVVLAVVVPVVYHQAADAAVKMPEYAGKVRARVAPLYERLNLRYPEQTDLVRERIAAAVRDNLPGLATPIVRAVGRAFSSVLSFVLFVLNLVVIPVFAFYLIYDMNRIRDGVKALVPHRFRAYAYSRAAQLDRLLSAFARGQVTVCLILGAFYAVGLSACGVPMGLVAGFVIGFFNLIPFMSYVLGLPLALLLSWLDDQSAASLIAVAAVFAFGQFVEGNFITPRIVGQSLGLHAVVVMLAVLVGGTTFGLVGMLLAVPVTAGLSVFWADLRDLYLRSGFYRGGAPPGAGTGGSPT